VISELEVLKDVCGRLDRAGISYMLTGSMAMNFYAQPRMTRDIDIVIEVGLSDAPVLQALFEPDYYVAADSVLTAVQQPGMFNILHLASVVKVVFVVRKDESFRRQEFQRRRQLDLSGAAVWVVSKEDLILSKLLWARESASELQTRDVRNLLNTGPDMTYVRDWAARLGLTALLDECLK